MADLQHAAVGQHRAQCVDRRGKRHLLRQALVPQRQIGSASRCHGKRQTEQRRLQRVQPVGLGIECKEAAGGDTGQERAQRRFVGDGLIRTEAACRLGRLWRLSQRKCRLRRWQRPLHRLRGGGRRLAVQPQPRRDAAEALRPQPRRQRRLVIRPSVQLIDRHRHRRVGAQRHQLAREARLLGVLDQIVAPLRRLHRRRGSQHGLQIAELVDELRRALRANAGHARHVVHRVADQRLDVDHLVRRHAEFLHDLGRANRFLLDRVQHFHAGPDQLHQVLVGRHDGRLAAGIAGRAGIRGDQVVGLPVLELNGRNAERLGRLAHQAELRDQVVGRRRALRLVGVVQPVAEGLAAGVEDHRDMRADMLAQQLRQHVGETEHRVHRRAVRPRHRRQRVVGAEEEARSVDQDQMLRRVLGARPARPGPGCQCPLAWPAPSFST